MPLDYAIERNYIEIAKLLAVNMTDESIRERMTHSKITYNMKFVLEKHLIRGRKRPAY